MRRKSFHIKNRQSKIYFLYLLLYLVKKLFYIKKEVMNELNKSKLLNPVKTQKIKVMKELKEFLNRKVGNQISGVMPMWFYLSVLTCTITPFVLKAVGVL
jgi:hypothetical protein